MMIAIWKGPMFQVHYQRPINPSEGQAEWAWGPPDGAFLVPISEAHALALVTSDRYSLVLEVHSG